jgi:hypothetical protein
MLDLTAGPVDTLDPMATIPLEQKVEEVHERNRRALRRAKRRSAEVEKELEKSEQRINHALALLRRAGYR